MRLKTKNPGIGRGKGTRKTLTVLTDEQRKELLDLAIYLTWSEIADWYGFHRATFGRMLQRDSEMMMLYKKGKILRKFLLSPKRFRKK